MVNFAMVSVDLFIGIDLHGSIVLMGTKDVFFSDKSMVTSKQLRLYSNKNQVKNQPSSPF